MYQLSIVTELAYKTHSYILIISSTLKDECSIRLPQHHALVTSEARGHQSKVSYDYDVRDKIKQYAVLRRVVEGKKEGEGKAPRLKSSDLQALTPIIT